MKNFLRFLLALFILLIAAILVLGVIEPKDVTVQRSVMINAPAPAIFDQIVKFKNWPHWSPWYQMEPSEQISYYGIDGQVGSGYHWVGQKTGTGDMKNTGVTDRQMNYLLSFIKPFKKDATGFFKLKDTAGQTMVTWSVSMHTSFPWNASAVLVNMDKMLGPDFENGLNNLKKYVEGSATTGTTDVQDVQFPGHAYATIRKKISWNDMHQFFADSYSKLANQLGSKIQGTATGIYYMWDTVNHMGDIAAAFPIADTSIKLKDNAAYIYLPSSAAYRVVYKGDYNGLMVPHRKLQQRIMTDNKKLGLVVEEYVAGPGQEKDSTKWITNIYYLYQ